MNVVGHPLVRHLVTELRDRSTPDHVFRTTVRRLSAFLLYEALADLPLMETKVESPFGTAAGFTVALPVVAVPILRAGLGMAYAAEEFLPFVTVLHLGLFRDEATLEPVVYYNRLDGRDLSGSVTVVMDPMLATAGSAIAALDLVKAKGAVRPRFVGILGSRDGARALASAHGDVPVTLAALDERLTTGSDKWPAGFIVPGLGDAGDRQFGTS